MVTLLPASEQETLRAFHSAFWELPRAMNFECTAAILALGHPEHAPQELVAPWTRHSFGVALHASAVLYLSPDYNVTGSGFMKSSKRRMTPFHSENHVVPTEANKGKCAGIM